MFSPTSVKRALLLCASLCLLAIVAFAQTRGSLSRTIQDPTGRCESRLHALLGKILVKQNKPAEALQPLENAIAKDATDPEKRYLLARAYQQLGRREDAAREFAVVQKLKAEKLKKDREITPKP